MKLEKDDSSWNELIGQSLYMLYADSANRDALISVLLKSGYVSDYEVPISWMLN